MYKDKLALYYDDIYSDKDYKSECELIKKFSPEGQKLFDIGCGTMTHSILLSDHFNSIMSTDLSSSMMDIGIKKMDVLGIKNITPICGRLEKINNGGTHDITEFFDTAISMFNVVNHIGTIRELDLFFKCISESLKDRGVFIFDCWNGVACTIEKPRPQSTKTIFVPGHSITTTTETTTSLMNSVSHMKTNVKIYDDVGLIDSFEYSLDQTLWTPAVLTDLLKSHDIEVNRILPYFKTDGWATENDYRLTFICKKDKK